MVPTSSRQRRVARGSGTVLVALAILGACGGGGRGSSDGRPPKDPEAARGQQLVEERNCLSCHTTNGKRTVGPSWKGLAGSTVHLSDGRNVTADRAYIVQSITDPDAATVQSYPKGLMATVIKAGSVNDADANAIAAYIETLR
jgi:cytochrome c oxidase subunit II